MHSGNGDHERILISLKAVAARARRKAAANNLRPVQNSRLFSIPAF